MAAMERCGTTKLQIKKGSFELNIERESQNVIVHSGRPSFESDEERPKFGLHQKANAPLPKSSDMAAALHSIEENVVKEAPGIFITSPMVGTFYAASSPDEADYVKVGDVVEKGRVVCIIEAMKVMNEIKATNAGTIVEVLVENGHPVEFGAKLFRIQ